MIAPPAFWGPMFPDYGHAGPCFWGPAFPDCFDDPTVVAPAGPITAATFVLDWENLKLRLSWPTDIIKSYSGLESRAQPNDFPAQTFNGAATLDLADALADRGALARYAAQSKPFLVGLPYEAIAVMSVAGPVLAVPTTTLSDWCVPGQRVIVQGVASIVATIQSVTAGTVTLDVSPSSAFVIMPAVAAFLDAQQSFQRYQAPGSLETWQLSGRHVLFGFESGADKAASVALAVYTPGYLNGAFLTFVVPGAIGNGASLQLVSDNAAPPPGMLVSGPRVVNFHFKPLVTTLLDLLVALGTTNLRLGGSFGGPGSATLRTIIDEFGPAPLSGGTDKSWGTMGIGAAVTLYLGSPVWDRELAPASDSIHSMAALLDLGGVPAQFQTATVPDWGRTVSFSRMDPRQWQWLKAFLAAVRGQQVAFWLPTMREDLMPVTLEPGTLKVSTASGDFGAWYPALRDQLRIDLPDGSTLYAEITAQADNGDGTRSLTITASNAAYSAGGGGVEVTPLLVSWLDLCRFESPDFDVTWSDGMTFSLQTQARAVQR